MNFKKFNDYTFTFIRKHVVGYVVSPKIPPHPNPEYYLQWQRGNLVWQKMGLN